MLEIGPADEAPEVDDDLTNEAARWRRQLRDTETERGQLAAQVATLRRTQAEQLITAAGLKPAAVFAVAALDELLGDDGCVDPGKITAAVQAARDELGIRHGVFAPAEGHNPDTRRRGSFTDAFKAKP